MEIAAEVLVVSPMWSIIFWINILVPMVTVFIAMYGAQHIFNKNARRREDRERRLKALEKLLTDANETGDLLQDYLLSRTNDSVAKNTILRNKLFSMLTLAKIYFHALINPINTVTGKLNHLHAMQLKKSIPFQNEIDKIEIKDRVDHFYTNMMPNIAELLDEPDYLNAIDLITDIVHKIIKIHNDTEKT